VVSYLEEQRRGGAPGEPQQRGCTEIEVEVESEVEEMSKLEHHRRRAGGHHKKATARGPVHKKGKRAKKKAKT
jgi:hypothetical protein